MVHYMYRFGKTTDGNASMKDVLGGKGANLAEMCNLGLPVPSGFTLTTDLCKLYKADTKAASKQIGADMKNGLEHIQSEMGYVPLLSVRSGARVSMPGMMDTILNVGLTAQTLPEWEKRIGVRATLDSYRRLIQMFGSVVKNVEHKKFEDPLKEAKNQAGVKEDSQLDVDALKNLIATYLTIYYKETGESFPDTLEDQLGAAAGAVFQSWDNERAKKYRKLNTIPDDWGTAVTVQAMVFGNMNEESGSGVLFSRDPATGENVIIGEFLSNAQGEDVVSGIRTPLPLYDLGEKWPQIAERICEICESLEMHFKDMQDIEFTVQNKELFLLQCRSGKRTAKAAFAVAVDMVEEGLIDKDMALSRLTSEQYRIMKRPAIDPKFSAPEDYKGLPACVGIAIGRPVFSSKDAEKSTGDVILVTKETTPEDIGGMIAAKGILTQTGGTTSHAAVVARSMDKPCVVGCTDLDWNKLKAATLVAIDGATGRVWIDQEVPVVGGGKDENVTKVTAWLLEEHNVRIRTGRVRAGYELMLEMAQHTKPSDWAEALMELATVNCNKIIVDLTPPELYLDAKDRLLWGAFGQPDLNGGALFEIGVQTLMKLAKEGKITGLRVKLPEGTEKIATSLAKAGMKVFGKATTVSEMLTGSMVPDPEFVEKVLGGPAAYDWLVKKMQEDGIEVNSGKIGPSMMTEEAVYKLLGKK